MGTHPQMVLTKMYYNAQTECKKFSQTFIMHTDYSTLSDLIPQTPILKQPGSPLTKIQISSWSNTCLREFIKFILSPNILYNCSREEALSQCTQ